MHTTAYTSLQVLIFVSDSGAVSGARIVLTVAPQEDRVGTPTLTFFNRNVPTN